MIDQQHKMAGLVAYCMRYCHVRQPDSIDFPDPNDPTESPSGLGFHKWWKPLDGMEEDWYQEAHLLGEKPCVLHICKNFDSQWFAYITHGWKNGPFHPAPDHPAIADNVSIAKRLAGVIGASVCFLKWNMHDKRIGDFTGEVILCKKGSQSVDVGRLLRCYVTDQSFRIAWYSDDVKIFLTNSLESGEIKRIQGFLSMGHDKLKDHMSISVDLPETDIEIYTVMDGLDMYDFCE